MIGKVLGYGAISALASSILYANLPTRYTIGGVLPTAQYLASGVLRGPFHNEKDLLTAKEIKASDLFRQQPATLVMVVRRPGCQLCRHQAGQLSTLDKELREHKVATIGVLHESLGAEEFHPFLKNSELYFDEKKHFYGPKERWLPFWMGFLRYNTWFIGTKAARQGYYGNYKGEGRLLGGIYLVKGDDEMLYAKLEEHWGDEANLDELRTALAKI